MNQISFNLRWSQASFRREGGATTELSLSLQSCRLHVPDEATLEMTDTTSAT